VTSFGAFVEIEEPFVEGLIKLDSLGEAFEYDEVHMRLSGKRSGRTLELGDKVVVEINNVSVIRRRIDFTLVETALKKGRTPRVEANPRASVPQRKKAGREVERAQLDQVERGAGRRDRSERGGRRASRGSGGKLQLGVSHRGVAVGGGGRGKKSPRRGKK
jgi:ribonuclease R